MAKVMEKYGKLCEIGIGWFNRKDARESQDNNY